MSKTWTFKTYDEDGEVVTTHRNLSNTEAAALIDDAIRGADYVRHTAAGRDEDKVAELTPRDREESRLAA